MIDFSPVQQFMQLRDSLAPMLPPAQSNPAVQQYANLQGQMQPGQPTQMNGPAMPVNPAHYQAGLNTLTQAAWNAGFRGQALTNAVAIGLAESGGNPNAHNGNAGTGDNSYGLFQINMLGNLGPSRLSQYHLANNNALFDPYTNAKVAYQMSGGGQNFHPWTTYTTGKYQNYLQAAHNYINSGGWHPISQYT